MNEMAKNLLLWLIIAVVLLTVFQTFNPHAGSSQDMSYTTFAQQVDNGNVASSTITSTAPRPLRAS